MTSMRVVMMPSGLFISCAMPAAIVPSAASFSFWYSTSRWRCSCVSTRLRSVMSVMNAMATPPSADFTWLRLISTGNSVPSLRRPERSRPIPIGRMRGSAK